MRDAFYLPDIFYSAVSEAYLAQEFETHDLNAVLDVSRSHLAPMPLHRTVNDPSFMWITCNIFLVYLRSRIRL